MDEKEAKRRHAEAQRRHAAKLRQMGTPRREDIARAMLTAIRQYYVNGEPTAAEKELMVTIIRMAIAHLSARGFKPSEAHRQLVWLFDPKNINF